MIAPVTEALVVQDLSRRHPEKPSSPLKDLVDRLGCVISLCRSNCWEARLLVRFNAVLAVLFTGLTDRGNLPSTLLKGRGFEPRR